MGVTHIQPSGGEQLQSDGKKLRTLVVKGDYADVLAEANARPRGTHITGYGYVLSWTIQRGVADNAICTYQLAAQTSEAWEGNEPLSDTWALKYMRVEIPIARYGGPSEVNNANLYDLARWQQEPDRQLYIDYSYKTKDRQIVKLSAYTIKLAQKIQAGYETVVRHTPIVTRKRIYANLPVANIGADIDHIDTPGRYASAAAAWLKIQDDADEQSDGNTLRLESWMGAEHWDQNFYGNSPDRWEFGTI